MKYTYKGIEREVESPATLHTSGKYLEDNIVIEAEGGIQDISTAAEMDALIVPENDGKMYRYVGTSTSSYINGRYYKVVVGESITIETVGNYGFTEDSAHSYADHGTVYKSTNKNQHNTNSITKVTIRNAESVTIRINSYAESSYDYTILSKLDAASYPTAYSSTYTQIHTRGYQRSISASTWDENAWRSYTFTGLGKAEHFVYIVYRKDNSQHSYDDEGRFIVEDVGGVGFFEYEHIEGNLVITDTASHDVSGKKTAQVVDANIVSSNIKSGVSILGVSGSIVLPSGNVTITENGSYNIAQYETAIINVSGGGGGSGHKVYFYSSGSGYGGYDDGVYIRINEDTNLTYKVCPDMPDTSIVCSASIMMSGISSFRLWGADHGGTYPGGGQSWVRWRPHNGSSWTNYALSRTESGSTILAITEDIDFEIYQNACLAKGTLITMADGTKKLIEEIEEGDMVLGITGAQRVRKSQKGTHLYIDFTDHWFFEDGTEIKTTGRHEFYNYDLQKMEYLDEWEIGDRAVKEDGTLTALVRTAHEDVPCHHFSLWTDDGENYYANGLLAGNRFTEEIRIDEA